LISLSRQCYTFIYKQKDEPKSYKSSELMGIFFFQVSIANNGARSKARNLL